MDEQLKQRLVGAAVLVLLAVIFVPMVLDRPPEPQVRIEHPALPPKPATEFSSRIVPLGEPETPLLENQRKRRAEPREKVVEPSRAPAAEKKTAEPEAMAAVKTPAPAPEPKAPPEDSPAAWAIQLGSFSSADNASALRDRLQKMGYVAFIETARVGGKEITRVFVGPELARERAGELVEKLQSETELKGMVVQYPAH